MPSAIPAIPVVNFLAGLAGTGAGPDGRLAGMTLRERWGGWKREPFTGDNTAYVSVCEKTA